MSKTPHEYYLQVIGKRFDEDGVYGCQCVDGFKHFCRTELGLNLGSICYPTGYATSIWDNFEELGLDKYFDKVPADQMVDGDWTIWSYDKKNRSCPYSHVAMFRKDNGNGTGVFLGQNQNGHPEFTQVNIYYDGVRGGLRPKIFHEVKPTPQPTPSKHPIYETLGDMYVRWDASYNAGVKLVKDLTEDGKKHATSSNPYSYAVYKKGTRFTVYELKDKGYGLWGRSPSGWICIKGKSGTEYCKEV